MTTDAPVSEIAERYQGEDGALRYFEERRWPNGAACPKCGSGDVARGKQEKRRRQLWYCHNPVCEHMFSVTSGTIMEFTKLPLHKWMLAYHLMGSSKGEISGSKLSRMLSVTHKTALLMAHRIREATVG